MKKHKIRSKIISTVSLVALISMNGYGITEASWGNNNIQLNNGGDTYTADELNKVLLGGNGDDIITINGNMNKRIESKGGNDIITINTNSNKINSGDGDDTIVVNGSQNKTISLGKGNNSLTISGNSGKIYMDNGNDTIKIGGNSNNPISLEGGNNNLEIGGNANKVYTIGNGNNKIKINGAANSDIGMGNGDDIVSVGLNTGGSISLGNGNDTLIVGGTSNRRIYGGKGDDIICVSRIGNYVNGENGNDTIYYETTSNNSYMIAETINQVADINSIDACKGIISTTTNINCVSGSTNGFSFPNFNHDSTFISTKTISVDGGEQTLETTLKCNNGVIETINPSHAIDVMCTMGFDIFGMFCKSNTNDCNEGTKNGFSFPFFNHQATNFAEKITDILNGSKITKVTSTCTNGTVTLGTEETVTYSCDAGFNDDDNNGTCEANDAGNYAELNVDKKGEMLVAGGCNNFLEGKKNITFSTDVQFDSGYNFIDTVPFVNYLHSDGHNDNSFRIEIHPISNNKFKFGLDLPGDSESSDEFNKNLLFDGNKHNITIKIQNKNVKYIIDGNIIDTDTFESQPSIPGNGLLVFGQEQDRRGSYFDKNNEYTQGKIYSMKFFSSDDTSTNPIVEWNMDNFTDNKTTSTNGNYTLYKTSINSNSDNISPTAYSTCIDTTPDNITIDNYSNLKKDESIVTPEITLKGINTPINVSISDGEIILNGEDKGSSTTAEEFDTIKFEMKADTNKTVTINIGGVTKNISLATIEEVAKKVTLCHRTNGTNSFVPINISVNAMNTHIDHHFDYISEDDTCSCTKGLSTTNLVSNGSFETFSLMSRIKSWYNSLFGFINKFNNLTGWNSTAVNFELWKNYPGSAASKGDTFIELDVDRNSQDKISQNIITQTGKKYILGFDLKGRIGDSDGVIVKYNNQIVITANGGDDWIHYETMITGVDGTSSISFEEPSQDDNSFGTWLDNISVKEIVKSCPTDDTDSSGLTPGADSDSDGILDTIETGTDTDGDGIPNYLDTDSDGDGILDSIEGTGDDDSDSIMNFIDGDNDTDGDGIADIIDGTEDTDGDGTLNYNDLDSDNDGISDSIEGAIDTDGDNIYNFIDTDADGDNILDSIEGTTDTDGDGIPNYLDIDSDDDGINDSVEGTTDTDNDGTPNYLDSDSDNDGIPDIVEGIADNDNDGIPNYLDTDSDGDGILDQDEITTDTDSDGIPDYLDADSDSDGIPDYIEITDDPDNDGIPNYLDTDSDGDNIPDETETNIDTDGDGIPDYTDTDSDNDGISDEIESNLDSDGDGIPDYQDTDSDNDGVPDAEEGGNTDTDNDGIPDYKDEDSDGSTEDTTPEEESNPEETEAESTAEQNADYKKFVKENIKECKVDGNKLILQFSHTYNVIK